MDLNGASTNWPESESRFLSVETSFDQALLAFLMTLAIAMCFSFLRLMIGPTVPDRAVSFDQLSLQAVGIILLVAMLLDSSDLVDIAIVIAVLGFLGTFLLAQYMERNDK